MPIDSYDSGKPRQLKIPLEHATSFERDDFLVTKVNAQAAAMIDAWPDWPAKAIALVGPPGAGKSHLGGAWARRSGAVTIAARSLGEADVPNLVASGAALIEDADRDLKSENALFHLINLAREQNAPLLLTGRSSPAAWNIQLPDLKSRLRAMPVAGIAEPDEPLLNAVLAKLFADRQLRVEPAVISYIALRMPRSMQAARDLVADLDDAALAGGRAVTRDIARLCLENLEQPE